VGVLATQGDKRQFLTTMDPDVIRAIKQKALDLDRTASDVMEEAARDWLERHKHKEWRDWL
jgi:Ribbon-helix-helix protein, copG family